MTTLSIDDLYTDSGTFDEQKVLATLRSRLAFTKNNEILFLSDPSRMKANEAIILFVLAKKLLKFHQKIESEIITSAELTNKTKINKNTIGVTVMRLNDKKILVPADGGYEMPTFKVEEALSLLKAVDKTI
jgi:hypothetical protein